MKIIFTYLLSVLFLFAGSELIAQPVIIDVSTGINNAGLLIPVNSPDDSWQVMLPGSNVYQDVKIGLGKPDNFSVFNSWYNGKNLQVGWLSPHLCDPTQNCINGSGRDLPAASAGNYTYRTTFNISSCPIQSYDFELLHFMARDEIIGVYLNNVQVASNWFTGSLGTVFTWNGLTSGLQPGQNELKIKVRAEQNGYTGFEFWARYVIRTCASAEMTFKDKDGSEKMTFCLDEDVFLNTSGSIPSQYKLSLLKLTNPINNVYSPVANTPNLTGSTSGLNVTDIFANQYGVNFSPGTYKVKVTINGNCGQFDIGKDFTLECCDNSPDASFDLINSNGTKLIGSSTGKGNHAWYLYSVPGIATGQPTEIGIYETQNFLREGEGRCYYVKHTLTNACGTNCLARTSCNLTCEEVACVISTPQQVQFDRNTNVLSWAQVNNAQSYIVQIVMNDPNCPNCEPPPVATSADRMTIQVPSGTSCPISVLSDNPCFSWKIFAVCADGTKSAPATGCSQ